MDSTNSASGFEMIRVGTGHPHPQFARQIAERGYTYAIDQVLPELSSRMSEESLPTTWRFLVVIWVIA